MSFLDRINAMKAKKAAEEAAKAKAENPAEEAVAKPVIHKPVGDPLARLRARQAARMAVAKKPEKEEAVKEEPVKKEETAPAKEETLQEKAEAVMKKIMEEPVKMPEKDNKTAAPKVKKEEPAPVKPAEETSKAEPEETETKPEPVKAAQEKPTAKKAATKKVSKKPAAGEGSDIHAAQFASGYDVLGTKMDFDQMTDIVLNYFEKDDWKETEAAYNEALSNVRIEGDMNTGTLRYALADLNNLNDEITQEFDKANKLLQTLTDHDFGAATAVQAMGAVGSNSEERKRNGFIALTKGKIDGHDVNYIALVSAARCRYVGLNSLLKRIKFKADICITMLGALKTEVSLMGGVERKDAKIA